MYDMVVISTMREILASIDIGSYKIKLVVAEIMDEQLNILCALDEESRGVKNGIIIEPNETEEDCVKREVLEEFGITVEVEGVDCTAAANAVRVPVSVK